MARADELWVCHLHRIEYGEALGPQGRHPAELPMGEDWYRERGIEIVETDRGGKVTYHGPGQLVGYPIVRVDDVVAYVRLLEQALVTALREVEIAARARDDEGPDYTGVWIENRKIASIGVHVARGVTTHGFAINVEARALEPFTWVVACGLPDVQMTSVESEGGAVSGVAFGELATASLAGALGHRARS